MLRVVKCVLYIRSKNNAFDKQKFELSGEIES